jgi:hypothetical protein
LDCDLSARGDEATAREAAGRVLDAHTRALGEEHPFALRAWRLHDLDLEV